MEVIELQTNEHQKKVTGRVRLTHYHPELIHQHLQAGDLVRVSQVRLKQPRNFKNPGAFDYRGHLRVRGIAAVGTLSKKSSIKKLGTQPLPFYNSLQTRLRDGLLKTLEAEFPDDQGALLKAMLLGQKNHLSDAVKEAYIATGLSHLMAVSGLHVGFVAWAAFIIFWPLAFYSLLKYRPEWAQSGAARKIAAFLCLFPVLFYLLLVGPKISALRAGFMVLILLFAILVNRERNLFNILLIAAFLLLIWNPQAVLDVSFQLSFSAMAGILLVVRYFARLEDDPIDRMGEQPWYRRLLISPPFEEWQELSSPQKWMHSAKKYFAASLLISFAVYVSTLPFLVFHFNRMSLVGPFLNLFMIPLASILIPLALFSLTLGSVFPAVGWLLSFPLHLLLECFLTLPQFFATFPYASVTVPSPPHYWILLYAFVLAGGFWLALKKPASVKKETSRKFQPVILLKGSLICASLGVLALMIWPRLAERPSELLKVSVLDVGKMVVAPFLWHQGIGHIDYLAASHSDQDHISGVESLVDLFSIGHFLDGFSGLNDSRIDRLKQKALSKHAVSVSLQPGASDEHRRDPVDLASPRPGIHPAKCHQYKTQGRQRIVSGPQIGIPGIQHVAHRGHWKIDRGISGPTGGPPSRLFI